MSLTKKFFKALLKQHLGPYLMGEMLCLEQIEAGLGSIKLHDLQFDPQKINEKLVGSPVLVKHMHILHATISIPLINWNENCKLKLEDFELILEVNNNATTGDAKADVELLASIVNGADSIFEDGLKKMISEEEDNSKRSKKVLIQFLEQLFFGAEVEIINAAIRLEARDEQHNTQHKRAGLAVLCPRFYYHNPQGASNEPTELHKVVTITGLRIGLWDLSGHGQNSESVFASSMLTEAAVRQRLTTLFTTSQDIHCDVKVQIEKKFQPRSREEVTARDNKDNVTNERKTIKRVDLQCDVNEVHCCLNPKQMHRVLELLTAVTTSTAGSASVTPSSSRNIAGTAKKQTRSNMHLSASPNDKYMFQSYVPDYVDNSDDEYTSFSEGEEDEDDDSMDQIWFKADDAVNNNNNNKPRNNTKRNSISDDGAEDDDTVIISAQLIKSRFPDDIDEFKDVDDDELNDVMGGSADKLMIDKAKIDWSVKLNMQLISLSLLYDSYHSPKVLNALTPHTTHHNLTHDHLNMVVQQFNINVDHTGSNRVIDLHIGDIAVTEHFFKVQHGVVDSDIHSSRSSEFTDVLHDEDLNSDHNDNHIVRHLLRVESPLEGPNTLQRSHHGPALILNLSTTRGLQSVKAQLAPFRLEIDVDLPNRLDNWLHALEGWSKERAVKSTPSPATPAQRINSRPSSYKSTSGSFKSAPRSWSSTSNKSEELSDRVEELMHELKISGEFLRIVVKFPHREEKHESNINSQFRRDARTRREALVLELINPQVRCHSIVNHPSVQYHFHFDQLTAYLARNHEDKMTGWRQILEIHQLSSSSEATEPVTLTLLSGANVAPAQPVKLRENDGKEPWQQWRQQYEGPFQSVMTVTEGLILNSKTENMDPVPVLLPVDELISWKSSTMESCRLVLTLTFPHVTVDLARSDYALMMELIESLLLSMQQYSNSVTVTRDDVPSSNAVDSLSTAAVMLHIKSGGIVLHHEAEQSNEPSYSYGLEVDGVQLFTVSGYKGSTKSYMTFAMDTLTAVDNRRDRELLAYKSQRSGLKLKGRDVLSVTTASDTRINQPLHSVMLINVAELLLKQTDFTWLTNFTHYVTRTTLLPEIASEEQLFVTLDDVTWQITHPNKCAGVLTAQSLKLAHRSSQPVTATQSSSYAALANHLTLFVLANTDHAKPVPYHTIFSTREDDTQLTYQQRVHEYWRTCGYVPVAHQDFTELSATSHSNESGFQLKVSNNLLTVDTCVDSFKALQNFITSWLANDMTSTSNTSTSSAATPIEVQPGPNNNDLSDDSEIDLNVRTPNTQSLLGDSVREDYVDDEKQDEGYVIFALDESDVITPKTQPLTSVPLLHSQPLGTVSRRDSEVKSVHQNTNAAPRSEGTVQWLSEDQQLVLVPDYLDQISRDEEDFVFKLPAHYPNPISSVSLIDIKIQWNLHSGHDWGRLAKRGPALMQLSLDKLNFQQLYFPDPAAPLTEDVEHPAWRINLAVYDVVVYDLHPSSSWNKFLCHNVKIARPHFNAPMLSTVLQARHRSPTSLAYHWKLSILPLRLNIDQDTLSFLNEYFTEAFDSSHSESTSLNEDELPWIESVEVLPIRALVDVKVKEVSQVRSQALSVLSTENAQLDIKRIRISDVRGWSAVMHAVASEATRQLLRQAPGQYIAGLRGLPHYLSHLSSAVSGLVLVPWQEYSKSGNVSQGFVKAWTNFARELTVGSADLAGRAMVDASALLDRLLGDSNDSNAQSGTAPGDKRPSKYAGLPSNTTEGLQGAWESMSRELKTAKDRLFVVPMREYKQRGTQGLLRSVVKGVPVAIVKPLIGTTEGLGKVFLGVRNSIDKTQKLDSDNKYGKK